MNYYNKYNKYKTKFLNLSKQNKKDEIHILEGGMFDWTFDLSQEKKNGINNIIYNHNFSDINSINIFFDTLKTNNLSYFDILYNADLELLKRKLGNDITNKIPVYKFEDRDYYNHKCKVDITNCYEPNTKDIYLNFSLSSDNNNNNIYIFIPLQGEHTAGNAIGLKGCYENLLTHIPGCAKSIYDVIVQKYDFNEEKNLYITGDSYGGLLAVHILFIYKYFYKLHNIYCTIFGGLNGLPRIVYDTFTNLDDHILYFCYKDDKITTIKIVENIDITSPANIVHFYFTNKKEISFDYPKDRITISLGNTGLLFLSVARDIPFKLYNRMVEGTKWTKYNVVNYFKDTGGHYLSFHNTPYGKINDTTRAYTTFIDSISTLNTETNTGDINNHIITQRKGENH